MEVSTAAIIIIWASGVLASIGISFVWKHDFYYSDEAIKHVAKISVISLPLSWVFFFIQAIILLSIWAEYYNDDDNMM